MWLCTRSQLEEFISSPLWNKTTALAADFHDDLGIAYPLGYPGTFHYFSRLHTYKQKSSLLATHGHGIGTFPLGMQKPHASKDGGDDMYQSRMTIKICHTSNLASIMKHVCSISHCASVIESARSLRACISLLRFRVQYVVLRAFICNANDYRV